MNQDPQEVFSYTRKQRLHLLANLITDKIIEDRKQGYPLLKRIKAEERKATKRKAKRSK